MTDDSSAGRRAAIAAATLLAMLAFAANSLLCRRALGAGHIDAASFASLRMLSGAGALILLSLLKNRALPDRRAFARLAPNAAMLFVYMAGFSFAYLSLGAGTGALILFGAVQLSMFVVALRSGEHFSRLAWAGWLLAISGLLYLLAPGLAAPDPVGAALMAIAGIAWGVYSILGRKEREPLSATAVNFTLGIPLVLLVSVISYLLAPERLHADLTGIALAIASGALASGCGYVIWYAVLPHQPAARAAAVQLSVPAIAALGGILFIGEALSLRLVLASLLILGGIGIVLTQRHTAVPARR